MCACAEGNPFECVLYLIGEMRVWSIVSKYEVCSTTLNRDSILSILRVV